MVARHTATGQQDLLRDGGGELRIERNRVLKRYDNDTIVVAQEPRPRDSLSIRERGDSLAALCRFKSRLEELAYYASISLETRCPIISK